MKRENLAITIAVLSFVFWIAQNVYFGWNIEPLTAIEEFCDALSLFGYFIAFLVKPSSNTNHYVTNGGNLIVRNLKKSNE